ncbi:hypothetical protein SCLCIDRAFT_1218604, partial [Scleroderma citrinum Foug A]
MVLLPLRHRRAYFSNDEGGQVSHSPSVFFSLWFTSCSASSLGSTTNLQLHCLAEEPCY